MDKNAAIRLIHNVFQNPFDRDHLITFTKNLFNFLDTEKNFIYRGNFIPDAYKPYIHTLERIGKYQDAEDNKVDVLIVHLKKERSIEYARTMQRNFIAWYLSGSRGGELKDAALVAFYTDNPDDWRFSLVKMDYQIVESPTGKIKTKTELTPARRLSFLVGKNENSHTAQRQLLPILQDDRNNPTLKDFEEAFNIEKVTKEFFEKYRKLFLWSKETLDDLVKKDSLIREDFDQKQVNTGDFTKKLLGQIVFLYFLQKKGWFGVPRGKDWGEGDKKFLRNLFLQAQQVNKNYFNKFLEPLFYEALRLERPKDYYDQFDCRIPFLNGGLFDPINDYDWQDTDIELPNNIFSNDRKTKEGDTGDGILDIFDRYNFTVKEDEPLEKEVAIDPEMLGKVFENLLEENLRKGKGTYYTPREIVHYMCQESLINYLISELSPVVPSEARNLRKDIEILIRYGESVVEHDSRVEQEGKETLTYSYKLPESVRKNAQLLDDKLKNIRVCDPAIGSGAFPVGMMNEIIRTRNTLTNYLEDNTDRSIYNFKRDAIQNSLYGVDIDPGAVEIAKLRLWLSLIVDEEERETIQPLPNLDYKIMRGNSLLGIQKEKLGMRNMFFEHQMTELEELKRLHTNEATSSKKKQLKDKIDELISGITNGHKDFDFEVYFSEVFHEKGGFDVVIANPPYEEISEKSLKATFQAKYSEVLSGHYDLFIFFIKRGADLLREGGSLSFIVPHTYLHYPQFHNLRKWLYDNMQIVELTQPIHNIFRAIVDNSILFVKNSKPQDSSTTEFTIISIQANSAIPKESSVLKHNEFDDQTFDYQGIQNLIKLKRFSANTMLLGDVIDSSQGITVYAKAQGAKINYFRNKPEDKYSKPLVKGKDVFEYYLDRTGAFIQYGDWLWCPRNPKFFENKKIFLRQTSDRLIATYVEEPMYCIDSVHSLINKEDTNYDLKYVLAILNSNLGNYLYQLINFEKDKVFAQVKLTFLRKIPIKKASIEEQQRFVSYVDKIIALKKSSEEKDSKQVLEHEKQIDQLVYKLYGLTQKEIATIEG